MSMRLSCLEGKNAAAGGVCAAGIRQDDAAEPPSFSACTGRQPRRDRRSYKCADLRLTGRFLTSDSRAPDGTQLMIFESRNAKRGWTGLPSQGAEAVRAVWDAPINPWAD